MAREGSAALGRTAARRTRGGCRPHGRTEDEDGGAGGIEQGAGGRGQAGPGGRLRHGLDGRPSFNLVSEGPRPGEVFRRETRVAGTKADVVLGLFDGRIMCLECKVSNSEVNSYKRLNHEVIDKVAKWTGEFGRQCVPGAVLKGCFKASNLVSAQGEGAFLFWSSSLDSLVDFVNETKRR